MEKKVAAFQNRGMIRDVSISKSLNELAYENFNIRITARDHDTLLSVTNERGNIPVAIYKEIISEDSVDASSELLTIEGTLLGYGVLNSYLVLFTTANGVDHIYRITCNSSSDIETPWRGVELIHGDLNFNVEYPIETLVNYESEDIQKIYWTDGLNQPRFINISDRFLLSSQGNYDPDLLDFVSEFDPNLEIEINKQYIGTGNFPSGTIQYVFTYSMKYGQETNIIRVSPMYYLSPENRGGNPEESVNCQFRIHLENLDQRYDCVNIYSIIRTSLSGSYTARLVGSLTIAGNEVTSVDTGSEGVSVDYASLLYKGGREISAYTMSSKDNTLFLGNLKILNTESDSYIKEKFAGFRDNATGLVLGDSPIGKLEFIEITDRSRAVPYYDYPGNYPYECQLNYSSDRIRTFKCGEKYRFGCVFISKGGSRSSVYWIGDLVNHIPPKLDRQNLVYYKAAVRFMITDPELLEYLYSNNYRQAELVMAEATYSDREILAQGFVNPTVFNLSQRCSNAPFSVASWYLRPRGGIVANRHYNPITPNYARSGEIQCINKEASAWACLDDFKSGDRRVVYIGYEAKVWIGSGDAVEPGIRFYNYYENNIDSPEYDYNIWYGGKFYNSKNAANWFINVLRAKGVPDSSIYIGDFYNDVQWENAVHAARGWKRGSYTLSYGNTTLQPAVTKYLVNPISNDLGRQYANTNNLAYFVDESVCSFFSPDINGSNEALFQNTNCKFRIVGIATITANQTSYDMQVSQGASNNAGEAIFNFNTENFSTDPNGLITFPLYYDSSDQGERLFYIYPWHKTGSIPENADSNGVKYSVLESKTWANLKYSYETSYIWNTVGRSPWSPDNGIEALKLYNYSEPTYMQVGFDNNPIMYQGNYDYLLSCRKSDDPEQDQGYYIWNSGALTAANDYQTILDSMGAEVSDSGEVATSSVKEHLEELCYSPVSISFKTTEHAVISFKSVIKDGNSCQVFLPDVYEENGGEEVGVDYIENPNNNDEGKDYFLPWNKVSEQDLNLPSYKVLAPSSNPGESSSNSYTNLGTVDIPVIEEDYTYFTSNIENYGTVLLVQPNGSMQLVQIHDSGYAIEKKELPEPWGRHIDSAVIEEDSDGNKVLKVSISFTASSASTNTDVVFSLGDSEIQNSGSQSLEYILSENSADTLTIKLISYTDNPVYDQPVEVSCGTVVIDYAGGTTTVTQPESGIPEEPQNNRVKITLNSITAVDSRVQLSINDAQYIYDNGNLEEITVNRFYYNDNRIVFPEGTVPNYPFVFIGELYQDFSDNDTRYGGIGDFALENNTFISLEAYSSINGTDPVSIIGYAGDTYFQRWDSIISYPFSEDKENNMVEMVSLMLECHSNIEGRYDNRRGLDVLTKSTPENTNLMNEVYSDLGEFRTSAILDDKFQLSEFPSQFTWSLTKTPTEEVDTWTNTSLSSVQDMDGDKGPIKAIRRFQNSLISFQDKGIAEILYNTRTQLATTQGVPIEIANSGKVDGKRYITDKAGCVNKWSIVETGNGIYFIDNINSSISLFNGAVQSLSDIKGFKNWIGRNNNTEIWNPVDFNNFISYWDRVNDDVYFVKKRITGDHNVLCYNEQLKQFVSFYDYGNVPMMTNIQDNFLAFRDGIIWKQGIGSYSRMFGEYQPFYIMYRITPDPYGDKIFTNLTYRADMFDMNRENEYMPGEGSLTENTFDTLEVWNEYQGNKVNLEFNIKDSYPDKRRKFRIWRMDIPRDRKNNEDNFYGLNRIRNPWIYLKLQKDNADSGEGHNERMEFHDLAVSYFE